MLLRFRCRLYVITADAAMILLFTPFTLMFYASVALFAATLLFSAADRVYALFTPDAETFRRNSC